MGFLLIALSLVSLPVKAETKYIIQWRDAFGEYHNYKIQYEKTSAYKSAEQRARYTNKVYRIIDGDGKLINIYFP